VSGLRDRAKSRLLTLHWFLRRPGLWGQAVRAIRRTLLPHPREHTRNEAIEWCETRAIEPHEALLMIFGVHNPPPFAELYPDHYASAWERAERVPGFMGGAGEIDLLYHAVRSLEARRVLETGVALGWSSLAILSAQDRSGRLVSTDMPYVREGNEDHVGAVVPDDHRRRWTLLRGADRRVLPRAIDRFDALDLAHYDSDKSYVGRMWAYPRLWEALRPGGALISDDIDDNVAFRDFARSLSLEPTVVRSPERDRYVGVLMRPD